MQKSRIGGVNEDNPTRFPAVFRGGIRFLGRWSGLVAKRPGVDRPDRVRGISTADRNAFLAQPECEIVAICDVDDAQIDKIRRRPEKVGKKRPESVKDFRRIPEHRDVDVRLVCTPDHWHALPTIAALEAGKDVYVEKPLALTIGEGRAMRDATRRHGRICQMGTQWRGGEHYWEAVEGKDDDGEAQGERVRPLQAMWRSCRSPTSSVCSSSRSGRYAGGISAWLLCPSARRRLESEPEIVEI